MMVEKYKEGRKGEEIEWRERLTKGRGEEDELGRGIWMLRPRGGIFGTRFSIHFGDLLEIFGSSP